LFDQVHKLPVMIDHPLLTKLFEVDLEVESSGEPSGRLWAPIVAAPRNLPPLDAVDYKSRIQAQAEEVAGEEESSEEEKPFRAAPGGKPGKNCHICDASDHTARDCPEQPCNYCKQSGHVCRTCPKLERKKKEIHKLKKQKRR
jgi:hypothetical protein